MIYCSLASIFEKTQTPLKLRPPRHSFSVDLETPMGKELQAMENKMCLYNQSEKSCEFKA